MGGDITDISAETKPLVRVCVVVIDADINAAAGWGRIVNTCSFHGLVASAYKAPYVAAKHGIAGFTKSVALEVAKSGVTVNAVCPGYVLTELVERQLHASALSRGITPQQVRGAEMLFYSTYRLCHPEDSFYL